MKTYNTRRELHAAYSPITRIVSGITQAMEVANRADSETRHEDDRETGNLPQWADSNSVYGKLRESLDMVLTDFFGVAIDALDVNWGGNGSFERDIFQALAAELVKPAVAGPVAVKEFTTELVLERGSTPVAESLGVHHNKMSLFVGLDGVADCIIWNYGKAAADEDETVIGLEIDGMTVNGYDGVMSLPREAVLLLVEAGYDVEPIWFNKDGSEINP